MPRLVKGSAEAKEFMAKIRAMRKGGATAAKGSDAMKAKMAALRAKKAAKKSM